MGVLLEVASETACWRGARDGGGAVAGIGAGWVECCSSHLGRVGEVASSLGPFEVAYGCFPGAGELDDVTSSVIDLPSPIGKEWTSWSDLGLPSAGVLLGCSMGLAWVTFGCASGADVLGNATCFDLELP